MNLDHHTTRRSHRGITLIEVLIAIGILAVGLASVVAVIPAGRSQAARAVVLDRASNLAANALSDAATFGLLRPDALTAAGGFVVVDPLGLATFGTVVAPRQDGIFSRPPDPAASNAFQLLFAQGRDDLVFASGATVGDLPLNEVLDGVRAFQGRVSCIYGIQSGTPGRLSVVVFHARERFDPTLSNLTVNVDTVSRIDTAAFSLPDREPREVLKPGVVLYGPAGSTTARFHQVVSLAFASGSSSASAFATCSTGTLFVSGTYSVLPDSVGLAERPFMAEDSGPYLK